MPIKASHELVLHPALHPHIKISAGVQPANQFLRFHIRNMSDQMIHIMDRMNLSYFQPHGADDWSVQHRGKWRPLSSFLVPSQDGIRQ